MCKTSNNKADLAKLKAALGIMKSRPDVSRGDIKSVQDVIANIKAGRANKAQISNALKKTKGYKPSAVYTFRPKAAA